MSDQWLWCSCTTARLWCESLASCSEWLYDRMEVTEDDAPEDWGDECAATESTSAPYSTDLGTTSGTTTTSLPATWSASTSW